MWILLGHQNSGDSWLDVSWPSVNSRLLAPLSASGNRPGQPRHRHLLCFPPNLLTSTSSCGRHFLFFFLRPSAETCGSVSTFRHDCQTCSWNSRAWISPVTFLRPPRTPLKRTDPLLGTGCGPSAKGSTYIHQCWGKKEDVKLNTGFFFFSLFLVKEHTWSLNINFFIWLPVFGWLIWKMKWVLPAFVLQRQKLRGKLVVIMHQIHPDIPACLFGLVSAKCGSTHTAAGTDTRSCTANPLVPRKSPVTRK